MVTQIASELAAVDEVTMPTTIERVLADLIAHFDVDFGYLRRIDRERKATILVAEWPRRSAPDPDPLNVVYFDQAYSPFHAVEKLTEPMLTSAESYFDQYVTSAVVPLVMHGDSIGLLGFVKHGDWAWSRQELAVLTVIASLLAQSQARVDTEARLRHLSTHDELTELPNHHSLFGYLGQRLRAGRPGPVAALCVGLNGLKLVNSYLGRTAGDDILRDVASRLREQLELNDMIVRFGGDEFVVVPNRPMDNYSAELLASRIKHGLSGGVTIDGETVSYGVDIGVAVGIPGDAPADVLRRADLALRAAKTQDSNGVAVFTDTLYEQFELADHITLNLRSAVSDNSLVLHYQPEVDLRNGRVLAVEALVRWQHPTRGLLLPDIFVGVAETTKLADELGNWVIRNACAQFADWRRRGFASDVVLRVNASPKQLTSPNFVERVEQALREHGLNGNSVCLEITENVSVEDLSRAHMTLHALKRLNVQIAIDDFGTGYNTLSHLKALPVDTVKIDRSFVKRLNNSPEDRAIVESIIGLAHEFGLEIIGEGVETAEAARTLLDLGCHRAQGFLITRPLPAEEIEAHLNTMQIPFSLEHRRSGRSE
ncbi:putative bifunctional diguanylate cyclase/phosphodiesterase [Nocardia pseudovaccinii]|uniref:putative bifunctional diguanylate cyclase/phosphodiesterase n=1 Tax=Nocardia pseudovaccinii TaxID=189540 RepID=UPI003D8DC8B6